MGDNNNSPKASNKNTAPNKRKNWFARYSVEIQAISMVVTVIVTSLLAYYAFKSWEEVKKQREIAHKQFVVANEPSVRMYIDGKFTLKEQYGWMTWSLLNVGGPVYDVLTKSIIIYYNVPDSTEAKVVGG